jgi:hypothetical protein
VRKSDFTAPSTRLAHTRVAVLAPSELGLRELARVAVAPAPLAAETCPALSLGQAIGSVLRRRAPLDRGHPRPTGGRRSLRHRYRDRHKPPFAGFLMSTLANWLHSKPPRLGAPQKPVGFLSSRCAQPTRKKSPPGQVLPQEHVGVLAGGALPGTLRIAEEDPNRTRAGEKPSGRKRFPRRTIV